MAQPYSDDLRRKLLQAYKDGKGTLEELAERFGVSYGYSKKIRQQQLRNHQMERVPQRYPRQRKLTEEKHEQLKKWVRERPDRTLAELQSLLWEESRLRISLPPIWGALRKMGLRLKKTLRAGAGPGTGPASAGSFPATDPADRLPAVSFPG